MRLTKEEEQILRAAVDRVIPPDDYPGAWQAGVGDYLARQFAGDLSPVLDIYRAGLRALDAEASARFGQGFALLTTAQQDEVLRHVEAGALLTTWEVSPARFFDLLVNTTAEGFYSDPAQGGNRDNVSWLMTGFEERTGA
ncbi:MAG: gluconate 2-dehydrogenase subunit 3 family protein [Pyrinomonadaceae bacterium]